jgi:hypothetical protein
MYLSDYLVGAFFGALITGFLSIAALSALARAAARKRTEEEK